MSTLGPTQREFLAALFARAEPRDPGLAVYRRTVLANLGGALAGAFPVVRRLVGDAFFSEAARRHALDIPSTSGDLGEYGAEFARFLAGYSPAGGLEYLPGVARLEWALHESHRAAPAQRLDFGALARVPDNRRTAIRLLLHPAVRLVRSRHPVLAIWQANQSDRDGTPDRAAGADHVLVHRPDLAAGAQPIDEREWAFLAALRRGGALEEAAAAFPDPEAIGPALARMAAMGVFCGFEEPAPA